ncbi:MAG TPA: PspC domain-containing protein [Candidatus Dormibacteraeota bacterium]
MQNVNGQRFYRSGNRILGGVCAGLAERFHLDPLWVRLAFLLLVFFQGAGLFVYIVLWLVMPERLEGGGERSGFGAMTSDLRRIWGELQRQLGSNPPPAAAPAEPAQPASGSVAPGPQKPAISQNQSLLLGVILVILGLGLLGSNIGIINWSVVWPAALITLGIVILVRNLERRP